MLNKKIITIGIVAVVALAVFCLGNLVMKTTPSGDAGGIYQYKIVSILPEDMPKLLAFSLSKGFSVFGATNDAKATEDMKKMQAEGIAIIEKTINDVAKDGWEYVNTLGSDGTIFIFRKK